MIIGESSNDARFQISNFRFRHKIFEINFQSNCRQEALEGSLFVSDVKNSGTYEKKDRNYCDDVMNILIRRHRDSKL